MSSAGSIEVSKHSGPPLFQAKTYRTACTCDMDAVTFGHQKKRPLLGRLDGDSGAIVERMTVPPCALMRDNTDRMSTKQTSFKDDCLHL